MEILFVLGKILDKFFANSKVKMLLNKLEIDSVQFVNRVKANPVQGGQSWP